MRRKIDAEVTQKNLEAAKDNASLAEDIKRRLLLRLKRAEEHYPSDATEVRINKDGKTIVYKLRDLTAAYKDLTGDMPKADATEDALAVAREILGGIHSAVE